MPYQLTVDVVPPEGGKVTVSHVFYGATEAEARAAFEAHAAGCEFLGPAIEEDRVEEELERIGETEWPEYEPPEDDDEDDADDEEEEAPAAT